jgi:Nif-specific regulatory protein
MVAGRENNMGEVRVSGADRMSLLLELSRALSALIELDDLLPFIIAKTNEVFASESCALLLLDEEQGELFFPVASDVSPQRAERLKIVRFPADKGVAGWVLQHQQATLVPDVNNDERFYAGVDRRSGAQTRQLLCAPLRTRRGSVGVIELRNKREGSFTEEDLNFLDALAGSIAIAVENARLYQRVRDSEEQLKQEVTTLQREKAHQQRFTQIIGASAAMDRVFALMETAISSPITVLLHGETGTGKERIAQAIHANGARKDRPFVVVNCSALPDPLLESELFGHKKGAFTGAVADKLGLFEMAHSGTVFLDEIGETTPAMQVKLLRVLQEGELRRVGETHTRRVDVRVLSATNRDLSHDVSQGRFREDLYYRLSVFPIEVPPLRERQEDIPLLAVHFLRRSSARLEKEVEKISPEALVGLTQYSWPGNVRELENEIERAVALTPPGAIITPKYLSERVKAAKARRVSMAATTSSLKQARLAFEREYLVQVLRQHQGHVSQAARVMGISRQMLQKKIKDYGLRVR